MLVTECEYLGPVNMTMLKLSEPVPNTRWTAATIDGRRLSCRLPMHAGDISRTKEDVVYVDGKLDLTGKTIEFT